MTMTEPINFEEILLESVLLELRSYTNEDELKEVFELIAAIEESGIYLFLSNAMAEAYADFIANKTSCRRFILGLHERFYTKLLLKAPNILEGKDFVENAAQQIERTIDEVRMNLQNSESLILPVIQANLVLSDSMMVLEHNRPMTVLYLASASGALSKAIVTISND